MQLRIRLRIIRKVIEMSRVKGHFFLDVRIMVARSLRYVLRSPDTLITTVLMPIAIMLLFVYVLGGAITVPDVDYVDYMLPGILLITVATGVSYTAFRVFNDKQQGIFERFRSMPIARSAPLWGHVITSLVSNAVSVVLVIAVAYLVGFRSSADLLDWLAVAGILVIFTLALIWIAVLAGMIASTPDGASAFSYPLVFLPFLSSAFVPIETMPWALQVFADNQPVTPIVDSIRALLGGGSLGTDIWIALAWCIGILIVANILAVKAYRKG